VSQISFTDLEEKDNKKDYLVQLLWCKNTYRPEVFVRHLSNLFLKFLVTKIPQPPKAKLPASLSFV